MFGYSDKDNNQDTCLETFKDNLLRHVSVHVTVRSGINHSQHNFKDKINPSFHKKKARGNSDIYWNIVNIKKKKMQKIVLEM